MSEPDKRISDADRHQVAELLREAAGEGRIDLEELDERLEATYAARTYADLVPITVDLPARDATPVPRPGAVPVPDPAGLPSYQRSLVLMGGQDRRGVWAVGASHTAVAVMGGVTIDLREAVFTEREVVIDATAIMGGVDVYVNARTTVVVDGLGIMGAFDQARDKVPPELGPDSPVVRVRGLALMGGVTVTRKPMPGEPKAIKRRHLGH